MKFKLILIMLLILTLTACEDCNIFGPDPDPDPDPVPTEYRVRVKITYQRNPDDIIYPRGNDNFLVIRYRLYDPEFNEDENDFLGDSYYDGTFRVGVVGTEKVGTHKFEAYVEHVLIQNSNYTQKHRFYADDTKLYDGLQRESCYTGRTVYVEFSYDIEIVEFPVYNVKDCKIK